MAARLAYERGLLVADAAKGSRGKRAELVE